jgi:hypothetical protein
MYPTYFDPDNPASQPTLFHLEIKNLTGTSESPLPAEDFDIKIIGRMEWRNTVLIPRSEITFREIQLLLAGQSIPIHNRDIITNDNTGMFDVDDEWDDVLNNNPEFKDLVVNSGRFPDGVYVFTFYVEDQTTNEQLSDEFSVSINLRSPNPITLITPGSPLGFGVSKVMDNQPYFVWFSNLNEYTLRIWELQHTNYSVQQIEGMEPYFEVPNSEIDLLNVTSFSLPVEFALENNKIYAWQVLGKIDSPAATNVTYEKSNVYLFEVSRDEAQQQDNQLLIQLLNQFSAEEVAGLEELLQLLELGYELKEEDYQRLMEMFSNGKKVKSITVR